MIKECEMKRFCLEKPYACQQPAKILDAGCETYKEVKRLSVTAKKLVTPSKSLGKEKTPQYDRNSVEISVDLKKTRASFREKRSVLIKRGLADSLSSDQIVEEVSKIYPEIEEKRIRMQVTVTRNALKRKG